jgi:amino acid transporter
VNRNYVIAAAWVTGMLFAPDNLIVLGNSAGGAGAGFILLLFIAVLVYLSHLRNYMKIAAFKPGAAGEFEWLADNLNPAAAAVFSIVPRILSAVCLATATLVAAGFVFNEVFVRQFPNFAFAFLMLGILLAINLYQRNLSGKIQILLSGTAVAGVFILAVLGILAWLKTYQVAYPVLVMPSWKSAFSVLLLFVGFDLLYFIPNPYTRNPSVFGRYLVVGLLVAGITFCLWGVASFLHVSPERLTGTYIPHILAAKAIWGQSGRIIMGLVIICGTGAAVNALFSAVAGMMADLSRKDSLSFLPRVFSRSAVTLILLTTVTALMMALGVAGTDELDTYLRSGLILWLLNYAVIHLAFLIGGVRQSLKMSEPVSGRQTVWHGAIILLMLCGSVILIATDDNAGLLIRCLGIIFVGIGLPAWLIDRWQSRRRKNRVNGGK